MLADGAGNTQFSLQCCFTKLSLPHANEDVKRNYFLVNLMYICIYQIKIDNINNFDYFDAYMRFTKK